MIALARAVFSSIFIPKECHDETACERQVVEADLDEQKIRIDQIRRELLIRKTSRAGLTVVRPR